MASAPLRTLPLAFAALGLAMGVSAAPAPARAAGIFDSVLGLLGGNTDEEPEVQYRDRAPLVVPPKIQLPPPQASVAERAANWPKDPDAEYQRLLDSDKKTPVKLRPDRVAPNGRVPVAKAAKPSNEPIQPHTERSTTLGESNWVHPDKMKSFGTATDASQPAVVAGQEPTRNYLTDPPPGLRVPAGNAPIAMPKKSLAKPVFEQEREERDPLTPYRRASQPQNADD